MAIDYSLFIVSRFRAELEGGAEVEAALERTMDTAGRAVAFSGIAVAAGLAGLLFYRGSFLAAMGLGGAIVVAFAVLFALTLLPVILGLARTAGGCAAGAHSSLRPAGRAVDAARAAG